MHHTNLLAVADQQIIIKVYLNHKIVPRDYSKRARVCTHTHTHRGTHTHKHSDYTKLNIQSLKKAANAGGSPSNPQRVDKFRKLHIIIS